MYVATCDKDSNMFHRALTKRSCIRYTNVADRNKHLIRLLESGGGVYQRRAVQVLEWDHIILFPTMSTTGTPTSMQREPPPPSHLLAFQGKAY